MWSPCAIIKKGGHPVWLSVKRWSPCVIIACSHFLRLFPWICPPQTILFILDYQYLGGGSLSPAGSGDHQAFCGLFQFDRQVNTAQCLPAIQPALLRWRRRQNAEHCEKNYTYTCNQSACGEKISKGSYFMSSLELDHLLVSRQAVLDVSQSSWLKKT